MHVFERQTDRQTNRWTDRILIAIPRLHSMQRGKKATFKHHNHDLWFAIAFKSHAIWERGASRRRTGTVSGDGLTQQTIVCVASIITGVTLSTR